MARLKTHCAGFAAAIVAGTALAQEPATEPGEPDLTVPPAIEAGPGQALLEPPPEREDSVDVVVTSGQTEFRLPDLGTSLREEREQEDPNQRIVLSPIRLYDPESEAALQDDFLEPEVLRGVGFIRVIEFRFGRDRRPD